jgi:hypothetical protein
MKRRILKASSGMILTDGTIYGTTIYLGESVDESAFYEIPKSEFLNFEKTDDEDYMNEIPMPESDINDDKSDGFYAVKDGETDEGI